MSDVKFSKFARKKAGDIIEQWLPAPSSQGSQRQLEPPGCGLRATQRATAASYSELPLRLFLLPNESCDSRDSEIAEQTPH
jgi:hypothetical protein